MTSPDTMWSTSHLAQPWPAKSWDWVKQWLFWITESWGNLLHSDNERTPITWTYKFPLSRSWCSVFIGNFTFQNHLHSYLNSHFNTGLNWVGPLIHRFPSKSILTYYMFCRSWPVGSQMKNRGHRGPTLSFWLLAAWGSEPLTPLFKGQLSSEYILWAPLTWVSEAGT